MPMRRRLFALRIGWPLQWLLVGFPVFWALGLASFATLIMAVPMAIEMVRRRPIALPRGFVIWMLFLLWSTAGIFVLGVNPSGTVPAAASSRLIGYGMRILSYLSVTVVLLYVGNLTRQVSQTRIIRWLGAFFISTALGGVLGMLAPNFEFTSPFEMILPASIRSNGFVYHLVHPASAQVMDLITESAARPAAPFTYTNEWSFHLTLLGIWFFIGWFEGTSLARRLVGAGILTVGAVVLIYSLNRAAWIGVGLGILYVALRLALRGKLIPLAATAMVVVVGLGVVLASPLKTVIDERLQNGHSNEIRSFTTRLAFETSLKSPIVGFGSTRQTYGSADSITVGKSSQCPQCGNASIGMNGYFYTLIMSTGYVGTALFFAFGAVQMWRARRLHSPTATAGVMVLILAAFYGFFYDLAVGMLVPFVTIGLIWRESLSGGSRPADTCGPGPSIAAGDSTDG